VRLLRGYPESLWLRNILRPGVYASLFHTSPRVLLKDPQIAQITQMGEANSGSLCKSVQSVDSFWTYRSGFFSRETRDSGVIEMCGTTRRLRRVMGRHDEGKASPIDGASGPESLEKPHEWGSREFVGPRDPA